MRRQVEYMAQNTYSCVRRQLEYMAIHEATERPHGDIVTWLAESPPRVASYDNTKYYTQSDKCQLFHWIAPTTIIFSVKLTNLRHSLKKFADCYKGLVDA